MNKKNKSKFSSLQKLDGVLVVGILLSVGISILLVIMGLDGAQGLIIGLTGTILTVLIDFIPRLSETEEKLIKGLSINTRLLENPWLQEIIEVIIDDYDKVPNTPADVFLDRAKNSLEECRDVLHGLANGYMYAVPQAKHTFGIPGINSAKSSIKAVSYAIPNAYWSSLWAEQYFQKNVELIQRGVSITRIFLAEEKELLTITDLLEKQSKAGITVFVAIVDEIPLELREDYLIQDEELVVKLELTQEGNLRKERISIVPSEVRDTSLSFERLQQLAMAYSQFSDN